MNIYLNSISSFAYTQPSQIAEDVEKILPAIIERTSDGKIKGLDYTQLVGPMIKMCQFNNNLLAENKKLLINKCPC